MEELLKKIEILVNAAEGDEPLIAAQTELEEARAAVPKNPSSDDLKASFDASQKVFSAIFTLIDNSDLELSDHEGRIAFHSILENNFYESVKKFETTKAPEDLLFSDVYDFHKELNKEEVEPSAPNGSVEAPVKTR